MVVRNLLSVSAQVLLTAANAASTVLKVLSAEQKVILETFCLLRNSPLLGSTVCVCVCMRTRALISVLVQEQNTGLK